MIDLSDFQNPGQAAHCFRNILDAFAKPGTLMHLPDAAGRPAALNGATSALALSLCDFQTPIWLSPLLDHKDVRDFLRFHTGAPIVREAEDAAFAILMAREFNAVHGKLHKGTDEYPDRSATAIVQVDGFSAPQRVRLEGPGIRRDVVMSAAGFGPAEWNQLAEDRILFPLGVDVALTSATSLVAIPRSTRIACLEDR